MRSVFSNPKKLFLIDAIGALLTAALLFFVVRKYALFFGVLPSVSKKLSFLAMALSAFSFGCHFFMPENSGHLLKKLALANVMYCGITIYLLSGCFSCLTVYGIVYFSFEALIILLLAFTEFRTAGR